MSRQGPHDHQDSLLALDIDGVVATAGPGGRRTYWYERLRQDRACVPPPVLSAARRRCGDRPIALTTWFATCPTFDAGCPDQTRTRAVLADFRALSPALMHAFLRPTWRRPACTRETRPGPEGASAPWGLGALYQLCTSTGDARC
jgi:hypothetical protein